MSDFEKCAFKFLNEDLEYRLKFIYLIQDWNRYGEYISSLENQKDSDIHTLDSLRNGFFLQEPTIEFESELCQSKSYPESSQKDEQSKRKMMFGIMESVYFPVIDICEHKRPEKMNKLIETYRKSFNRTILHDLLTIDSVIKKTEKDLNESQKMTLGRVMNRLVNQIPVLDPDTNENSKDPELQMQNLFYLIKNMESKSDHFYECRGL